MPKKDIPEFPHEFTEGDRLPEIAFNYKNSKKKGIDLTTHTIKLRLRKPDNTLVEIDVTDIDLEHGKGKFAWGASDLVAGKGQHCEIRFTDNTGKPLTSKKFLINVKPQN